MDLGTIGAVGWVINYYASIDCIDRVDAKIHVLHTALGDLDEFGLVHHYVNGLLDSNVNNAIVYDRSVKLHQFRGHVVKNKLNSL